MAEHTGQDPSVAIVRAKRELYQRSAERPADIIRVSHLRPNETNETLYRHAIQERAM